MLQQHVNTLKQGNIKLQNQVEENEQYNRRMCLQIDGVPSCEKESAEEVLDKVRDLVKEADVIFPDFGFDRAHRIGPVMKDISSDTQKVKGIIVRFTSFRYRTMIYRSKISLGSKVKIKLDLTKSRYKTLHEAIDLVRDDPLVKFAYANINCRLKIHLTGGGDKTFYPSSSVLGGGEGY